MAPGPAWVVILPSATSLERKAQLGMLRMKKKALSTHVYSAPFETSLIHPEKYLWMICIKINFHSSKPRTAVSITWQWGVCQNVISSDLHPELLNWYFRGSPYRDTIFSLIPEESKGPFKAYTANLPSPGDPPMPPCPFRMSVCPDLEGLVCEGRCGA